MEPAFGQYLKQFTGLSGGRDAGAKVFLLRNFPGGREPDPEAAAEAAQRDAQLINGLECKLSCSTSKARGMSPVASAARAAMPLLKGPTFARCSCAADRRFHDLRWQCQCEGSAVAVLVAEAAGSPMRQRQCRHAEQHWRCRLA